MAGQRQLQEEAHDSSLVLARMALAVALIIKQPAALSLAVCLRQRRSAVSATGWCAGCQSAAPRVYGRRSDAVKAFRGSAPA